MNVKRLQEIASNSPESIEVFNTWSQYERNVKHINISRFRAEMRKAGVKIDRETFLKVLRDLEREGWGRIILGSRGGLISFEFSGGNKIYDVGAQGLGKEVPKRPVPPQFKRSEPVEQERIVKPRVQAQTRPEWIVLCVPMLDGTFFKTHVPNTLTKADARRIGAALAEIAR